MKELATKVRNGNRNFKVKQFKLTEEDKVLLNSNESDLKSVVIKELETQVKKLIDRLDEMTKAKSKEEDSKASTTRKNIVIKLRKFKKDLKDEMEIKKRVNMLKLKKRKLKSLNLKIEEKLDKMKLHKVQCFKCRKRGHTVADCKHVETLEGGEVVPEQTEPQQAEINTEPEKTEKKIKKEKKFIKKEEVKKVLCYNCGSNEHNVHACNSPVDYANMPFAECFICKTKGHLSSKCPTNDHGIYPKGGNCFICQGIDHLAKNCPTKQLPLTTEETEAVIPKPKRKIYINTKKTNVVKKK